ncbi:hypothetical protein CD790_25705 [Streptomyces sp. SAJ15]|nr:hypothetical protein CD790_25705 [Streptomyces sp. SAJ15]
MKAVQGYDRRADNLRHQQSLIADERAVTIATVVAGYGRGGRNRAAAELAVSVGQVDEAIKRARSVYARELAETPPLTAGLWQALVGIMHGTLVDVTWLDQPGQLLAGEVEDAIGEDVDEDEDEAAILAAAARSWSRIQALAVLDAIGRRDLDALPTKE